MSSLKELQNLIQEKYGLDPAALDPTASMRDKGFDSLTLVEFVFAVEDHFKISMPDQDVNVDTLAELAAMVDKTLAAQAAAAQAK